MKQKWSTPKLTFKVKLPLTGWNYWPSFKAHLVDIILCRVSGGWR